MRKVPYNWGVLISKFYKIGSICFIFGYIITFKHTLDNVLQTAKTAPSINLLIHPPDAQIKIELYQQSKLAEKSIECVIHKVTQIWTRRRDSKYNYLYIYNIQVNRVFL